MFNKTDRTYEILPQYLSDEHAAAVIALCQNALETNNGCFCLVIHGGEPTLWPRASFELLSKHAAELRRRYPQFEISIQTNLLRPIQPWLIECLERMGARIGISLDGPPDWNDRHRYDHGGGGSYNRIMQNMHSLIQAGHEKLIGGILCVINPDIAVEEFFRWVKCLPVQRLDILWPIDFYQESTPWGEGNPSDYAINPKYGRWMADLFDIWWENDDPKIDIRQFRSTLAVSLGFRGHIDSLVNDKLDMFVVNTDGRIEYPDYLRATEAGSRATALNVTDCTLATIAKDTTFDMLLNLEKHLPDECRLCPHVEICGGGFLPGRASNYEAVSSAKSVLCADQFHYYSNVKMHLARTNVAMNLDQSATAG